MEAYRFVKPLRGVHRSRIVQFAWFVILGQLIGWFLLYAAANTPLVFLLGGQRELPFVLSAFPMFGGLLGVALHWVFASRRESDQREKGPPTGRRVAKALLRIPTAILLGFLMGMLNMIGVTLVEGAISPAYQWHYVVAFGGAGSVVGFVAGITWSGTTDRWFWAVSCVVAASFAGFLLSDLLPPVIEDVVDMAILSLYGLYGVTMLGAFGWGAVAIVRRVCHTRPLYRWLVCLLAACGGVAFVCALAVGRDAAGLATVATLQLLTPMVVVIGMPPRSPWCAAAFGAAVALVSIVVYVFLYAFILGIEGGHLLGDIGPGFPGLPNLVALLCLYSLAVFPVLITLVAGAIGGIVGWMLCRKVKSGSCA